MFARLRMGAGAIKREMESVCRSGSAATSIEKRTQIESWTRHGLIQSVSSPCFRCFGVYFVPQGPWSFDFRSLRWDFCAGRRLWARLCTGHTGPSIASWPGFALDARAKANPGSRWLAFSVLSKSHITNETIPTYQHSLADSIALRIHQALETLW